MLSVQDQPELEFLMETADRATSNSENVALIGQWAEGPSFTTAAVDNLA